MPLSPTSTAGKPNTANNLSSFKLLEGCFGTAAAAELAAATADLIALAAGVVSADPRLSLAALEAATADLIALGGIAPNGAAAVVVGPEGAAEVGITPEGPNGATSGSPVCAGAGAGTLS
ncbi:hypothetical protein C0991_001301 [Blastosporella zonata]|nr:hypothetical protein C0991_001301 [Blastosporella zonata]